MEEPLAMEAIRQTALNIAPAKVISTLSSDKTSALYGSAVNLSGQISLEDKSPVALLPIRIEGKSATDTTWRNLGSANTSVDGKFATAILLAKPMNIRIATDGTWERAESLSNEVAVQIDRTISLSAPGTEKAKTAFLISGTVRPRSAGAVVSLMKYTAGTWKNVATATTDEKGNFIFPNAGEARSIVRYQVIVQADSVWRQVAAPEFSIIIR
jgi:hypothetical protein